MRLYTQHISTKIAVSYDRHLFFVLEAFNPWGYFQIIPLFVIFQSYGHLSVISTNKTSNKTPFIGHVSHPIEITSYNW